MQKTIQWTSLLIGFALVGVVIRCYANDADILLTTNTGGTKFTVQNSNPAVVASIDSSGSAFISSNTILSGATFYNNGPITLGNAGQTVTISTNLIVNNGGTFYQDGAVTLGASGQAVTFSSNVILNGTTFYQNGRVVIGGSSQGSVTISTSVTLGSNTAGGSAVTISSNTILSGATFYNNGPILIGTASQTVTLSTPTINGGLTLQSVTIGQLFKPTALGQFFYCSNCTFSLLCVSTGTATNFAVASATGTTSYCH
jgi:hypothetical protein